MNSSKSYLPDYSRFSIEQFETTYEHLRGVIYVAGVSLGRDVTSGLRSPAGNYIEQDYVNRPSDDLETMMVALSTRTFGSQESDDRAWLLLLRYQLDSGDASIDKVAQAVEHRIRRQAA